VTAEREEYLLRPALTRSSAACADDCVESGRVWLPQAAHLAGEYVRELTGFPVRG